MKKTVPTITITTAQKLSAEQLEQLRSLVEKKIGAAEYTEVVDPNVLGGLRLTIGDQEFDTTIAGKLQKMDSQLPKVMVTTAVPLTPAQRKQIMTAIAERLGTVSLEETVDPEVIGGIRLVIGSRAFDGTVKGKLQKLKQLMLQTI